MEKTAIIGHIGKDSSVNEVNGRKAINFTVGVNRSFKKQDGTKQTVTNWYSCTRWLNANESAEVSKYLLKGTQVYVDGSLQPALYKNKDNATVIDLKLVVRDVRLLSSKKEATTENNAGNNEAAPPTFSDNDDLPF